MICSCQCGNCCAGAVAFAGSAGAGTAGTGCRESAGVHQQVAGHGLHLAAESTKTECFHAPVHVPARGHRVSALRNPASRCVELALNAMYQPYNVLPPGQRPPLAASCCAAPSAPPGWTTTVAASSSCGSSSTRTPRQWTTAMRAPAQERDPDLGPGPDCRHRRRRQVPESSDSCSLLIVSYRTHSFRAIYFTCWYFVGTKHLYFLCFTC